MYLARMHCIKMVYYVYDVRAERRTHSAPSVRHVRGEEGRKEGWAPTMYFVPVLQQTCHTTSEQEIPEESGDNLAGSPPAAHPPADVISCVCCLPLPRYESLLEGAGAVVCPGRKLSPSGGQLGKRWFKGSASPICPCRIGLGLFLGFLGISRALSVRTTP